MSVPFDRTSEEQIAKLVSKPGRRKITAQTDENTAWCKFVTGLFAELPQGDLFDRALVGFAIVNLPGWHFPNRIANGDTFLLDQEKVSIDRKSTRLNSSHGS